MDGDNGFFKQSDDHISELAGYEFHADWWSRGYEYIWAINFAEPGMIVADMGCGWMYRPFKDALAEVCLFVYAVDADERLHDQQRANNMAFVTADITKEIFGIQDGMLDRVFCISVLEDLNEMIGPVLKEFARTLHPEGLIVLTFDVQYDDDKPLPVYPGINFEKFLKAIDEAGLEPVGKMDMDKTDAVVQEDWNLCCYHCVLRKK